MGFVGNTRIGCETTGIVVKGLSKKGAGEADVVGILVVGITRTEGNFVTGCTLEIGE